MTLTSSAASPRILPSVLRAVPGTADVLVDQQPPLAQIAIKVDREAAARYGINVADIADLIQTGIGGGAVSQIFIGERHYNTTVRFPDGRTQQPRSDRQFAVDINKRRSGAALAGRRHSIAVRRKHH